MNEHKRLSKLPNEQEAGRVIGVTAAGMRGWRAKGLGPPWLRIGKRLVRSDPAAVRKWIEEKAEEGSSRRLG
jgi:hypothetical protein